MQSNGDGAGNPTTLVAISKGMRYAAVKLCANKTLVVLANAGCPV